MRREYLAELHYITPIVNIPSILRWGILSHWRAKRLKHRSVAMQKVQKRRAKVRVPQGQLLHRYANLYFHARNPMMYRRKSDHRNLCVLRVSTDVLDMPGAVIADQNASRYYARFGRANDPSTLARLDYDLVFAKWWTHKDQVEQYRLKGIRCAEVLVPNRIAPGYVRGAYVSCAASRTQLNQAAPTLEATVDARLFFQ